jgi:hypothetical protein
MGLFKDIVGGALKIAQPLLTAVNPLAGAALGFAKDLMEGKNPLEAALGAIGGAIPGGIGGAIGNAFAKFGGKDLLESFAGNGLVGSAMNLLGGNKGGVTDLVGDVLKATQKKEEMTEQSRENLVELAAKKMGELAFG